MVNTKQIVTHALNATTLLGCAHQKLHNRRKESIASALPKEIREVCGSQREVTSWLFGDDLAQAIKEAKEMNKLSNEIATGKQCSKQQFENPGSTRPHKGVIKDLKYLEAASSTKQGFPTRQETPLQGEARTPLIDSQVRNSGSDYIKFQPILHCYLKKKGKNFQSRVFS